MAALEGTGDRRDGEVDVCDGEVDGCDGEVDVWARRVYRHWRAAHAQFEER